MKNGLILYGGKDMPEVLIKAKKCTRCDHVWMPRGDDKPLRCPNCGSVYWDREYRQTKESDVNDQ